MEKEGVNVFKNILEDQGKDLSKFRNTYVKNKRPFIILKWAESLDGFMGRKNEQTWLSNSYSKRLVHKWRSEIDAIMVGTHTAIIDDPALTNRLYSGNNPLRIYIDKNNKVPDHHQLKDNSVETWKLTDKERLIQSLILRLNESNKLSLMVEGGAELLKSFIQLGLWDEIRIIKAPKVLKYGIKAPALHLDQKQLKHKIQLDNDEILVYHNL